jgi:hypothetical protein
MEVTCPTGLLIKMQPPCLKFVSFQTGLIPGLSFAVTVKPQNWGYLLCFCCELLVLFEEHVTWPAVVQYFLYENVTNDKGD